MPIDDQVRRDLQRISSSLTPTTRVVAFTGAGISAASGIPTFRGAQDSLWSQYRPEELATPEAFARDPELVWQWYDWRRGLIAASGYNAAHEALAALEAHAQVVVVTQNVDGYHQEAGSTDVLEFHGAIWKVRCSACGRERLDRTFPLKKVPHCEKCGGMERPGVVWFGEGIDPEVMRRSFEESRNCDFFLVVGTAGAVYPAAGLVDAARAAGATICEFNLERSGVSHLADVFVPGSADLTLPLLVP
nr:NAD-dependent protein deacylase [Candidatus Krumholzibacteria bacterium]